MARATEPPASTARPASGVATRVPPAALFPVSAVFHYLGPAFAVLLFAHLAPLGVMWLRIASAAVVLGIWRRPAVLARRSGSTDRRLMIGLAAVLVAMNSMFYLAVARLPIATVGAIEFLATIGLATVGVRTWRNLAALVVTVGGVALLTVLHFGQDPLGYLFAFANCAGFIAYVVLGHRIANRGDRALPAPSGLDLLAAAMVVAAVLATPVGLPYALPAFGNWDWLLWAIGVGVCSSVIPYAIDQFTMARLRRETFALMLALLPACAAVIGAVVLGQIPTATQAAGIALVVAGLLIHQPVPP